MAVICVAVQMRGSLPSEMKETSAPPSAHPQKKRERERDVRINKRFMVMMIGGMGRMIDQREVGRGRASDDGVFGRFDPMRGGRDRVKGIATQVVGSKRGVYVGEHRVVIGGPSAMMIATLVRRGLVAMVSRVY